MAKYTGPVCRLCRREGTKLFLKGIRCNTPKCAFSRRDTPPGMHGRVRGKTSEYGTQLREKQKVRRMYGVLERQFKLMFKRAVGIKGVTGDKLLSMLESRLDNVVYRAGFATARSLARQMVNHGLITRNGRKATIPSLAVRAGDVIGCRDNDRVRARIRAAFTDLGDSFGIPAWLQVNREQLTVQVARLPERKDVQEPINESLIVELYSK